MRKQFNRVRRGILLGAILFLSPKALAEIIKPRSTPIRIGQVAIYKGRKFTAIKSGKKIIWDNGVPLSAVSPSPSVSRSAIPSSNPSPSPSQSVANTPAPTATSKVTLNIVGNSSELELGETKVFSENDPYGRGARYIITRTKNGLVGFDNTCTHGGCGIEEILRNNQVRCRCHGAEFNAVTGEPTARPATQELRPIRVQEVDGKIVVLGF